MISYGESYDLFVLLIFANVYTIFENIAIYKQTHREFKKSIRLNILAQQTEKTNKQNAKLDAAILKNIHKQFEERRNMFK